MSDLDTGKTTATENLFEAAKKHGLSEASVAPSPLGKLAISMVDYDGRQVYYGDRDSFGLFWTNDKSSALRWDSPAKVQGVIRMMGWDQSAVIGMYISE